MLIDQPIINSSNPFMNKHIIPWLTAGLLLTLSACATQNGNKPYAQSTNNASGEHTVPYTENSPVSRSAALDPHNVLTN